MEQQPTSSSGLEFKLHPVRRRRARFAAVAACSGSVCLCRFWRRRAVQPAPLHPEDIAVGTRPWRHACCFVVATARVLRGLRSGQRAAPTSPTWHPSQRPQLVMINVSDHHTRVKANAPNGAASPVMGCLLGSQSGRVVDISNSFEIEYTMQDGKVVINEAFLSRKQEQCECPGTD